MRACNSAFRTRAVLGYFGQQLSVVRHKAVHCHNLSRPTRAARKLEVGTRTHQIGQAKWILLFYGYISSSDHSGWNLICVTLTTAVSPQRLNISPSTRCCQPLYMAHSTAYFRMAVSEMHGLHFVSGDFLAGHVKALFSRAFPLAAISSNASTPARSSVSAALTGPSSSARAMLTFSKASCCRTSF